MIPLKTIKRDNAEAQTLEWILHVKNYRLNLDKKLCVGCQICSLACPKEAIKVEKQPKTGERAQKAKVDIDLGKCNFCGICDVICPFGSIEVTRDGEHLLSVVEKESFPQLVRDIKVDASKFPLVRQRSDDICPLRLIEVRFVTADGKSVEDPASLGGAEKNSLKVDVKVDEQHCPCCGVCEVRLPSGAIRVRKVLSGKLKINREKCPEGCKDCVDVCPITGVLCVGEDNKVSVNEMFCVYCGACKVVCPVDEAMEFKRTRVNHTPIRSGAWNKALERLTSSAEMTKELKTKTLLKVRDAVKKRVGV